MFATKQESDKPLLLPSAPAIKIAPSVTVQPPLSRAGKGPGLIILIDHESAAKASTESIDPPPSQKWAEESFVVGQIDLSKLEEGFEKTLTDTLLIIKGLDTFDGSEKFGLICKSLVDDLSSDTDESEHICPHRTPMLSMRWSHPET